MSGTALEGSAHRGGRSISARVTIGALGVVYGDIGTSPLYAFKEAARAAGAGGPPSAAGVLGAVSLILWSLALVVSLKYAVLILRADNRGEGGIVALLALLHARQARSGWRGSLLVIGLVGAALLYGDGAITPAISVLSAVEGLKVDAPILGPLVVPLTILILIGVFFVQHKGTDFIGGIFGPLMLAWFFVIGILGIGGIMKNPAIMYAINPLYALDYALHAGPGVSFAMLGAAFLAVTGGEAMYADMGHFGANPIRFAWFAIVLPALMLNYFGQGALLLVDPSALENPFYQLAPDWAHYPLVAFATLAAVIASQAIISGAFSLTRQAIQLGFLPLMHIKHTGEHEVGHIYMPLVNWTLAAATLGAVLHFESSDALAGAYGIAVSLLMAITTLLAALVAIQWGYNPILVCAVNGFFLVIDLLFFGANSLKMMEGGWFPLLLAAAVTFVMLTWRRGVMLVEAARSVLRRPEQEFLDSLPLEAPIRLPGAAIFLSAAATGIPLPLSNFIRHNHALYERVILATVQIADDPTVREAERATVKTLAPNITRVVLRYGFTEQPSIPDGLRCAVRQGPLAEIDLDRATYYIGRETIIPTSMIPGMWVWREGLFSFMHRNAERTAAYFLVPARQAVEMGMEIEI
jgi:KUP system potassium uptake protein